MELTESGYDGMDDVMDEVKKNLATVVWMTSFFQTFFWGPNSATVGVSHV